MSWQNRIVGYANVPTEQLKANPKNWRVHNKRQEDTLSDVLSDVGIVQNIVVNQRTGLVVDGHLRLSLAAKQQQETVPVTYIDVSEEEEALIMATFDPIGALAANDQQKLQELIDSTPNLMNVLDVSNRAYHDMISVINAANTFNELMAAPPPSLEPITYDDAAPNQPVDKSKNLLGDPLSSTYRDAAPVATPTYKESLPSYRDEREDLDDMDDESPAARKAPKVTYTPRTGEEWIVDLTHRICVTDHPDRAWVDRDWRPIRQSKTPQRFLELIHRTIMDTQIDPVVELHMVSCTDTKHVWYQVALRPDRAAMLIANADDMNISTEML